MKELKKIQDFLYRLEKEKSVELPRLSVFADESCYVSAFRSTYRIICAPDIKKLLKEIDNYQWDTNTHKQK